MTDIRKSTLSIIKLDTGGFIGKVGVHPEVLDTVRAWLIGAKEKGHVTGFHILRCGPDLNIVATRDQANPPTVELALGLSAICRDTASEIGLSPAEQAGTAGPGVLEFDLPGASMGAVIVLAAYGTVAGSWNLPLSRIFADPFNTGGLTRDPMMNRGFSFEIIDRDDGASTILSTPKDTYTLISMASSSSRYIIKEVRRNIDNETACKILTDRFNGSGKATIGPDSPAAVIRCAEGFPTVGEALEPFALPHLVAGPAGGRTGPLMPVPFYEATPTRFNGPPRLIGAGFQLSKGRLIGPHDMFDDPGFDSSRRLAGNITDYLKRHGPFEPQSPTEPARSGGASPIPINRLR